MIAYSTVRNIRDNRPIVHACASWQDFADYLEAQSALSGVDKSTTLCISPAIYEDGVVRAKGRVVGWQWFAADIDDKGDGNASADIEAVAEKMFAQDAPFVIYTTSSHTPAAHRFRLMFPLDRLVETHEFASVWASMAAWLGCLDPATKDESRLFVAPRHWSECTIFFRHDDGQPVSVDLIRLTNPVQIAHRPSRMLTSAFVDTSGLQTPCPSQIGLHGDFVTPASLAKATGGAAGTRMFPFLVRTGVRALLKGYAITADDLATIGRQFAASIGRHSDDVEHDAENAHKAAVSAYAETKARRVEKLDPLAANFARWRS